MPLDGPTIDALKATAADLAAQIMALAPDITITPQRYAGNPIINIGGSAWYAEQVFDPQVMVDPTDSTKLIMFMTGMASPVASNNLTIGKFTSTVANYTSWSEVGQVLLPGTTGAWDDNFVRMGSCFYRNGTYYLYYTGMTEPNYVEKIGLATSTDGATFTKYSGNPILTPTGQGRNDGTQVSEPAVYTDGTTWTMIYAYRNGATVLPGFRYATSSSATGPWTKGGSGDILTGSPAGIFCEFHQIININGTFYLIFEAGNESITVNIFAASANAVTGPYSMPPLWFPPSGVVGTWDRYHVGTPNICQIGGNWQLFYAGAGNHFSPYETNTWPLGVAIAPYTPGQGWLKI